MTTTAPNASELILDTGMHYKIRNNTDTRLTTGDNKTALLRYNRIAYECGPGQEVIVPWPVIALYFGDPRSKNKVIVEATDSQGAHMVPAREEELLRLSVFYGVYEQGVDILAAHIPDVTITTLDGIEIVPPCFDPDNTYSYGFERNLQKSGDVKTLIDDLQRQIDSLKERDNRILDQGDNDQELQIDTPRIP